MDLWLGGGELGKYPANAHRIFAERRSHPVVPGGCRIAFVEDEIDHLQHRCQPRGQFLPLRNLERNMGF